MSAKIIIASLALVVMCALAAEAIVGKWETVNKSICDPESVVKQTTPGYTCAGCCTARGYQSSKSTFNYCRCSSKQSDKVRDDDELREYTGMWGKYDVHY